MTRGSTRYIERPSPNFGPRRNGARPDMVVLHYTGMADCTGAVDRLTDPASEVSAHYVIDLDGTVHALVAEDARAWHAGVAAWGDITDVNSHAIGIEIVNPGHELGYPPFPAPQMDALEDLLAGMLDRHAIPPERVVGHACVAPGRKQDPGEKFDWRRLSLRGLSVWLDPAPDGADGAPDADAFRRAAARFGYPVPPGGGWNRAMLALWRAYAMRFLPQQANDRPTAAGVAHLERLATRWPVAGSTVAQARD